MTHLSNRYRTKKQFSNKTAVSTNRKILTMYSVFTNQRKLQSVQRKLYLQPSICYLNCSFRCFHYNAFEPQFLPVCKNRIDDLIFVIY